MMQTKISAIVLAKNEEDRINLCLQSLSWVGECIVIDNGSSDNTVEIAKKNNVRVIVDKTADFSKLRNIGKEHAGGDWLLYVDADEQVTSQLREKLKSIVADPEDKNIKGYFIKRKNLYLGHPWPYQDKMQRFFWKKSLEHWEGKLHETAVVNGEIGIINEPLLHDTHRTLEEMVDKTNQWSQIEAQLRFESFHPPVVWWRFLRVMLTAFYGSFIRQEGWRAGTVGWIESIYQAFSMFITYAKLWELQQQNQKSIRQPADKNQT